MGCLKSKPKRPAGSKLPNKPNTPGTFRPASGSPDPPSESQGSDFRFILDGSRVTAFQSQGGFSFAFSKVIKSDEVLQMVEQSDRQLGQFIAYLPQNGVAIFATADGGQNAAKLECKVLQKGDQVRIGRGSSVPILRVNRQYINYDVASTRTVPPGTPVFSGNNIVGIHDQPGRALSMIWVLTEAKQNPNQSQISPMLKQVINLDFTRDEANKSRLYRISGPRLLSYYPDNQESLVHQSDLPENARICIIANGLYISGGLRKGHAVNETYIYDTGLAMLSPRENMSKARSAHCVCFLRPDIYNIGGQDEDPLELCEKYSLVRNLSSLVAELPTARIQAGASVFKNMIYVIGGNANGTQQAIIQDIISLTAQGWEAVPHTLQLTPHIQVAADPSNECLWILGSELIKWNPEKEAQKGQSQCKAAQSLHVSHSSLFVFSETQAYEVRIKPEPWVWTAISISN
jgi:hypothetical protein